MNVENPVPSSSYGSGMMTRQFLGTPLLVTTYDALLARLPELAARPGPTALDFSNTHIVTLRRVDREFREHAGAFDFFVPDGMPLIWALRVMGVDIPDRVYGPTFMRQALTREKTLTHYFLGGSPETLAALLERAREMSHGGLRIAGSHHGYFAPGESEAIVREINRLSPDMIWVGLGTPKQQAWIYEQKPNIRRGLLMAVGFAFDVNAGTKSDAPLWMQKYSLTWVYRIYREPARLLGRYLKYNLLFLGLCFFDLFCHVAWRILHPFRRS